MKSKITPIKLKQDERQKLEALAKKHEVSMSQIIRVLIISHYYDEFERHEKEHTC